MYTSRAHASVCAYACLQVCVTAFGHRNGHCKLQAIHKRIYIHPYTRTYIHAYTQEHAYTHGHIIKHARAQEFIHTYVCATIAHTYVCATIIHTYVCVAITQTYVCAM